MRTIRARLTYSNVVSTLALFLVLCGGAAYAAKVGKKTVGPSQLKANAVTTAKIKANAVTTRKIKKNAVANAKIKDGAVETEKIADGTITSTDLNTATMPFSRIVFETRGNATVPMKEKEILVYPLAGATYTQEANRDDAVMGALDVSFKPACEPPRQVQAFILADVPKVTEKTPFGNAVAQGQLQDEDGSITGGRVNLGSSDGLFQQPTATNHTLSLAATLHCSAGDGATATFGAADVIGTKK
jgi:hypothetical protein